MNEPMSFPAINVCRGSGLANDSRIVPRSFSPLIRVVGEEYGEEGEDSLENEFQVEEPEHSQTPAPRRYRVSSCGSSPRPWTSVVRPMSFDHSGNEQMPGGAEGRKIRFFRSYHDPVGEPSICFRFSPAWRRHTRATSALYHRGRRNEERQAVMSVGADTERNGEFRRGEDIAELLFR